MAYVDFEIVNDGIGVLTLNNPPLNLNTLTTISQIRTLCAKIAQNPTVRVVIVTGAGDRAFCVGSDISEFPEVADDVVGIKLAKENEAFAAIESLPQPVIGALNSTTLGGGAEIALACDIRILDKSAKIGFPEINLGVFPGSGGVFRLPWLIGAGRALELLYTGESISAEEALRIGLVNRLSEPGKAFADAVTLAETLLTRPSRSLEIVKKAVHDARLQTVDEAIARSLVDSKTVFESADLDEGVAAFFGKRKPVFPSALTREV